MTDYSPHRFIDIPYEAYTYKPVHVSKKDRSFLAAAAKLALTSDNRFKMACFVVRSGAVLGCDTNVTKTHPTTPPNRFSTHAEIGALQTVTDPTWSTLYIARLKLDGTTAIAKPCSWCMQELQKKQIYRVCFTTDEQKPDSFYVSEINWDHYALQET